jgi:hypothetical protein
MLAAGLAAACPAPYTAKLAPGVTRADSTARVTAPGGPCADSLYVALQRVPVDSLSERQFELFRVRDAACVQYRATSPEPPRRAAPVAWWSVGLWAAVSAAIVAVFTFGR